MLLQSQSAEFQWDKTVQGNILGMFFYGYFCSQVFGGYLADRIGGKFGIVFGIGVLSLAAILSPVMAR